MAQWQAALALVVLAAHPLACGGQKAKKAHHAPYDTYQGGPRAIMDVPAHACMPAQQWDAATLLSACGAGAVGCPVESSSTGGGVCCGCGCRWRQY